MLQDLSNWTGLSLPYLMVTTGMVFVAGAVRGFAGFGLSAVLMASIVVFIPPVELIPICFLLEAAASIAMFKGGLRDADHKTAFTLAICSAIGVPIGLSATTSIPTDFSKLVALFLVLTLTLLQLLKVKVRPFSSPFALPVTGLAAGIVTGLASIGGMVIALYVLASAQNARKMRGSLVLFLFCGMVTSLATLLMFDVLDEKAIQRGLIFVPVVLAGVLVGSRLFSRSLEQTYKRACLSLLTVLACIGLIRTVVF
ncbi:MAG: sulfite exporter TauE/SafE family protein [Pseudomonadota bacterium]